MQKIKQFYLAYGGKCFLGITAFLLLVAVLSLFFPQAAKNEKMLDQAHNSDCGAQEIFDGQTLELVYCADVNGITGLKLQFTNFQRENTPGVIVVSIYEQGQPEALSSYRIEARHISDGLIVDFDIPEQIDSHEKNYVVTVTSEGCSEGNGVGLLLSQRMIDELDVLIDDIPSGFDVVFGVKYIGVSYPYTWSLLLAFAFFLTLSGIAPMKKSAVSKRKAE